MRITVFSIFMIFLQVAFVLIFATTTGYAGGPGNLQDTNTAVTVGIPRYDETYASYGNVHVLVFVGLGIITSFVYRSSFTAAGFALMLASMSALWSILNFGFWQQAVLAPKSYNKLSINQDVLVAGDFGAATVLVSFGALVGRISAAQAVMLAFFEIIVYNILIALGTHRLMITDIGGSTQVFFFGAVFGLIASAVLAKLSNRVGDTAFAVPGHSSSTTAMIGTLFSWCFWPSFNTYFASADNRESYSIVNTYLALCSSTMMAFATTRLAGRGTDQVRTSLLATIAGGVAMGSASVMLVRNFGAILIGAFAGILSSLGQLYLTPALSRVGFPDTAGVFTAFGLPGLVGCIAGIITTASFRMAEYDRFPGSAGRNWPELGASRSAGRQAAFQLGYLVLALGLALLCGAIAGFLMWLCPALETTYNDAEEWVLDADLDVVDVEMTTKPEVTTRREVTTTREVTVTDEL